MIKPITFAPIPQAAPKQQDCPTCRACGHETQTYFDVTTRRELVCCPQCGWEENHQEPRVRLFDDSEAPF